VRCVVLARLRGCWVSTTILYLAIVAIWAGFLVPAWIRRGHGAETDADIDVSDADVDDGDFPAAGEDVAEAAIYADEEPAHTESDVDISDADVHAGADPVPGPPLSRQQMLRARRRVLAILLALAVGAAACAARGLLPWWAAVPPAAILTLYVLLLREVAKAEAESARRRAHQGVQWSQESQWSQAAQEEQAANAAMAARSGPARRAPAGPEPIADVIDISSRVSDQLYDQYADAATRAVGD
jgi:hypothetical protein